MGGTSPPFAENSTKIINLIFKPFPYLGYWKYYPVPFHVKWFTFLSGNEVQTCSGQEECRGICPNTNCIKDFKTIDDATRCSTTESKETMVVGISNAYCRYLSPCPTNYHARCLCCKDRHFFKNRCPYQCRRYCKASEENQGKGFWTVISWFKTLVKLW